MSRLFALLGGVAALALFTPVSAHAQSEGAGEERPATDRFHDTAPQTIIITAPFRRDQEELLSGSSVLTGQELTRELRTTIGETLQRQPGVSATSFGPNSSRPVLRGLQGERVRVLTDGIGSFDVSNTSVDHAVAINPLTANRIEVLRGPSTLLFGSSAIGGVVNVIDSRIPREVPDEVVHVEGLASYGSAADERTASAALDIPIGGKVVLHVDGSYAKSDDLEVGGFVLAPAQRAAAAASGDPDIAGLADLRGRLPNSAGRTWEVAGGAAVVGEGGNLGFSVSRYDSLYGVPVRYSLDPAVEAEEVRLDVRQTRADLRAEVETGGGFLERVRFRAGAADYEHDELEDTGEVATTFFNEALEGRLELVQADRGGWRGASGVQGLTRDFNVVGEEKFVPKNETESIGVFTLQTFDFGVFRAEAGARYERTTVRAFADDDLGNGDIRRRFNSLSGAIGASIGAGDRVRIGVNFTHSERAPSAEELFANGPHAGTQAFEIGDPTFRRERANGVEATLKGSGERYRFGLSAYYNWFSNFIYEQPTGEVEDDLPVFLFLQDDARIWGFEAEGALTVARVGGTALTVDAVADYVRGTVEDVGPLPRIPPLRLLGGLEAEADAFSARAEVEYVDAQDRVAAFETETDDHTLINASFAWRPFGRDNPTSLTASVNNILDVDARRHASFLKDFAPLAGRDFRISARLSF